MRRQQHRIFIVIIVLLWLPLIMVAQQFSNINVEAFAQKVWLKDTDKHYECIYKKSLLNIENMSCYVVIRTDLAQKDTLPGYMLIAANDNPTLLAFDQKSRFSKKNLPPHIKSWIKGYERMNINNSSSREELRTWMKASQTDFDDVPPLLGNKEWGQDNPYNLLCPTIDGKHCPTGCVATAISQIMSYHKWPLSGTGNISYKTSTNKIDVNYDFSNAIFEWDKMLDTYIPLEDLSSSDDTIVTDNLYYLNTIEIDNNSTASSKCYVNISGLTIMGTSFFDGEIVLVATDENDKFITKVSSSMSILNRSSGRILNNKSFLLYIPSSVPDGAYRIYCAARSNGTIDWSLSNVRGKDNYITLIKEGNSFSAGGDTFPCCPSTEDVTPVASLLQAVGAAVKMDYGRNGSGSYDTQTLEGLVAYLNYDSDMFFAYPDTYTDEQWHEILQQELAEGRPVYYTGQGMEAGHAFVIDGFKKADDGTTYYHVNWGWDGLCNGYYLLNMLRPSSTGTGGSLGSNYANQPSMLIGMKPEDGVSIIKMNCSNIDLQADDFTVGDFLPIRIRTLSLETSKDFTGNIQVQLQNEYSNQASINIYESNCTITSKRGLTNYIISCQIPIDITGGTYTLKILCTTNDGENVEIKCGEWPQINIKDISKWTGGPMTHPLKKLAIGGTFDVHIQKNKGIITLNVDSIVNPMPKSTNGHLALIICDENGEMLTLPSELSSISVSGYNLIRNINISSSISRYMPDGHYELRVGYLPQNDSLWTFCDKIHSEGDIWWASFLPLWVPMSITNGKVYIQGFDVFDGADTPWTNSIRDIISDIYDNTVYDLSGRKTKSNQRGVYIIRRYNKSVKIIK